MARISYIDSNLRSARGEVGAEVRRGAEDDRGDLPVLARSPAVAVRVGVGRAGADPFEPATPAAEGTARPALLEVPARARATRAFRGAFHPLRTFGATSVSRISTESHGGTPRGGLTSKSVLRL